MNTQLANTIRTVFERFPSIKLGYLFGSQATGTTGPFSDVDVAVYLDEPTSQDRFETKLRLMNELSTSLHRDDIDVVVLNDLDTPEFAYFIIADGTILHEVEPYRMIVEPMILNQ